MEVVFVSNYFNHHQRLLSDCIYEISEGKYRFIATSEMREERKALGYGEWEIPSYVLFCKGEEKIACQEIVNKADIVIAGSAPEWILKERIRQGKVIFRYSERPLKEGLEPLKYIPRLIMWNKRNPFWKPIYVLCASAYTAKDYKKFGMFINKTFKWGYFPELRKYENVEKIISEKKKNSILWVGRFLDWKHPEYAVFVAQRLKQEGFDFELNMIGTGEMEDTLHSMIKKAGLQDNVHILGSMTPDKVRDYMEKAEIYLFTSNRSEGWGAVLNEAMNSGCAVVGSNECGSVPFMIRNGVNGMIYENNDSDELYHKVRHLLENEDERNIISKNAYRTICEEWNAKIAVERFWKLAEKVYKGENDLQLYADGICSKCN